MKERTTPQAQYSHTQVLSFYSDGWKPRFLFIYDEVGALCIFDEIHKTFCI